MLSGRVYDMVVRSPLEGASRNEGLQPIRDLDSIRGFLAGQGPSALFDLPWLPIYLAIIFAFHFALGATALAGAIVLVIVALLTEVLTRRPITSATQWAKARIDLAEGHRRNAEVIAAMGMTGSMGARWSEANRGYMASNRRISDVTLDLGSVSRCLRLFLQSAVLAVGAYFVIRGEATGGIIIAGSILVARALAPVDMAIANWRSFVSARQSWMRLSKLLQSIPEPAEQLSLPAPKARLSVEDVSAAPPGTQKLVASGITFKLEAGQALGIIGPSASGKSSLARLLVGVWQPARGRVCLDGAALPQWSRAALGRHIGYLPQSV
jgi:ABC-type protease/lipase transport system fused ATPase/permease subunit